MIQIRSVVSFLFLPFLISCNIYSPLQKASSTEDLLEEALKCLNQGDADCALSQYEKLPEGELKNQKRCEGNLTKEGLTLNNLIKIVKKSQQTMLGELAQTLIPWSSNRQSAADTARSKCSSNLGGNIGVLLKTLGYISHCATLMAKTDNNGGNNDAKVVKADIDFMSDADALDCGLDSRALDANEVGSAGMTDISGAIGQIPPGLSSSAASTVRSAIKDTLTE